MELQFQDRQADVVCKKENLDSIAVKLKEQFIGLDHIIDEVIGLVSAWYIFPKAQMRPCVINLWGLTGSGKSALVNKLVDLLNYRNLYVHLDMNECNTQGSDWVKKKFARELAHLDQQQVILCLDEFQHAKSIDRYGDEIENQLAVFWDLIDTGKISGSDGKKTVDLDLRYALIFVLGNLDEAYPMSSNLDPDINADIVHERTKEITISGIKAALREKFLSEQISRLGNNHVIYRAFSSEQFKEIIRRELNRVSSFVEAELGLTFEFDASIIDLVYAEGVIPTQGTRPVYTTISNLIQSRVSRVAMSVSAYGIDMRSVRWAFEDKKFAYTVIDTNGNEVAKIREQVSLPLSNERQSMKPHLQAHTAVHESGHAIVATLLLRIIPADVVSRSAAYESEGFCTVRFPKGPLTREILMMDIAISLAGLAAEKIVFGDEFTSSGVISDIEDATRVANDAIRRYGMGKDPIRLSVVRNSLKEDCFVETAAYEEEAIELIRDGMAVADRVLRRNKLLLLKMSEYLSTHSKMRSDLIEEFVRTHSTEDWVGNYTFLDPETYYGFDKIIQSQLKEMEAAERSVELLIHEC